jgi:hypothetical protein
MSEHDKSLVLTILTRHYSKKFNLSRYATLQTFRQVSKDAQSVNQLIKRIHNFMRR